MRFTGADACRRAGLDLNKLFDGPDALRLLESQARIAPIDPKKLDRGIERKACRCLRGTQRRHPEITVGELKTKIWALVTRILQDEDSSFDEQTIDQARSQSLFDYRTDLRLASTKSSGPNLRRRLAGTPGGNTTHTWANPYKQLIYIDNLHHKFVERLEARH